MRGPHNHGAWLLLFATVLGCQHTAGPPAVRLPPFEILTTDSPFSVAADRRVVVDRARVTGDAYAPSSFELATPESKEPARIVVTTVGKDVRITAEIRGEQVHRSLSLRYPLSLAVDGGRLWLGRDYLHLDAARACFASTPAPPRDTGEIWAASLNVESLVEPGPATVVEQGTKTFRYRQRNGSAEVCLDGGKTYVSTWAFPADRWPVTYRSRLTQGSAVLLEQSESVTVVQPGGVARAVDRYYEVDES